MKSLKKFLGKAIRHRRLGSNSSIQFTAQSISGGHAENDPESQSIVENDTQSRNDEEIENDVLSIVEALRFEEFETWQRDLRINHQSLCFGEFLHSLLLSVTGLPIHYRWTLLISSKMLLIYEAQNLTAALNSKLGDAAQSSVLNFEEAIAKFLPVLRHTTLFILCYPLILLLVCPLPLVLQIIFMMVLIFVPLIYFPDLVDKVSRTRVDVACGSFFKLPLIWFTISGTLVLSLICVSLILTGLYVIWRKILKGKPSLLEPGLV